MKNNYNIPWIILSCLKRSTQYVFLFLLFFLSKPCLFSQTNNIPCSYWGVSGCLSWVAATRDISVDFKEIPGNIDRSCSVRVHYAKRVCQNIDEVIITGIETSDNTLQTVNDFTFTNVIESIIKGAFDQSRDYFYLMQNQSFDEDAIYMAPCWKIISKTCTSPAWYKMMILPCGQYECCKMIFQRSSCDVKESCVKYESYNCAENPSSYFNQFSGLVPYTYPYYPNFLQIFSSVCPSINPSVEIDCNNPLRLRCTSLQQKFECPIQNQ